MNASTPEIVRCLKRDMDGDLLAGARYAERIAAGAPPSIRGPTPKWPATMPTPPKFYATHQHRSSMKITVNIDTYHPDAAIGLKWQMPSAPKDDGPSSLYLLPSELVPTQHPHAVKDMSRVAVFYDGHFTLFYTPSNSFSCDHRNEHAIATARAEVIYCDTFKLLDVVRKLHAKRTVAETMLDTARFPTARPPSPVLTVTQLAAHPNLRNRDLLGKTLQHFRAVLTQGAKESRDRCRTFTNLMADLSHYVRGTTTVAAMGDEFYFDGRRAGGCGFNGGIIPHTFDNSYGIHT